MPNQLCLQHGISSLWSVQIGTEYYQLGCSAVMDRSRMPVGETN